MNRITTSTGFSMTPTTEVTLVMMNRAAGPPEIWEYAVTTLLMIATIILTLRGTAKVFRIGILMTGKPPRLMEIVKWFLLREGSTPAREEEA